MDDLLAGPLLQSGLVASVLAVPLLAMPAAGQMVSLAWYAGWLAALWLALAVVRRWPMLFAAFQMALCVSVGYGVTAWLETRPWVAFPAGLDDPRSLQAYGNVLGLLSLACGLGSTAGRGLGSCCRPAGRRSIGGCWEDWCSDSSYWRSGASCRGWFMNCIRTAGFINC